MTFAFELLRLWRSRRPILASGAILFFVSLMLLGFYTYAKTETGGAVEFRYTYENESYFNGLTFGLYAFYFGSLLILPIFAASEAGSQLAGDTASGVLRLMLARPVGRGQIFFRKCVLAGGLCAGLVFFLLLAGLGLGLVAVGWGDLDLYPGVLQMTEEHQHLQQATALKRFAIAWPAATLALLAPLSMSFLVASFVRSPVSAVATSVALYLVMYVIAEVHFFRELRPWLYTSHMSYWRALFQENVDWSTIGRDASKLAGFAALFLAGACSRFRTREEL